jgi:hypothetical protein
MKRGRLAVILLAACGGHRKRALYDPSQGYPNVGLRCVYAAR